ncbi:MAG: glycosyltransferase [Ruminococcaceae bacterium]|nr:glycosyltransferase [Oscillospiraceae bacterium]
MRVLLLSCNTGEGHNSCAKAIKEYFEAQGDRCTIRDGLAFVSDKFARFISWGHSCMYRHLPWLFKWGYGCAEKHPTVFQKGSPAYRFLARGTERLYHYLHEEDYDAIICTHVFTALMLTAVLHTHTLRATTFFVCTDYTCSPGAKESELNLYFIPDATLSAEFDSPNIPRDKQIPCGIPIRQIFYTACDAQTAKKAVGVSPAHRHLLLMCGSMGCGPIKKLLRLLSAQLPSDWELSVVCGNNKKLEKQLAATYREHSNIHIHGYVENMALMMESADLYLTKPGGISVTEAAMKQLPMVLIDAVAGCEEYNRLYYVRCGGAETAGGAKELAALCLQLMQREDHRLRIQKHLAELKIGNAAADIYDCVKKRLEETDDTDKTATADCRLPQAAL